MKIDVGSCKGGHEDLYQSKGFLPLKNSYVDLKGKISGGSCTILPRAA